MNVAIIKFGGSLITNKGGRRSIRRQVLARLAEELAVAVKGQRRFLLGHGSGSFGHVTAAEYGVDAGRGGAVGVSATQAVARELHEAVLGALRGAGLSVWSVAPSSTIVTASGRPAAAAIESVERALQRGLLATTYGDVVMDRDQGHAICSTETALLAFARLLRRRGAKLGDAYWLGDTDGIYDGAGNTIAKMTATQAGNMATEVGGSADVDVTGGMRHRLDTAIAFARLGVRSWIVDGAVAGILPAVLSGKHRGGTRIVP